MTTPATSASATVDSPVYANVHPVVKMRSHGRQVRYAYARVDVRPLLNAAPVEVLLRLLDTHHAAVFGLSDDHRVDWVGGVNGTQLLQRWLVDAQPDDEQSRVWFAARSEITDRGCLTDAHVRLDDPTLGWDWAAEHRWDALISTNIPQHEADQEDEVLPGFAESNGAAFRAWEAATQWVWSQVAALVRDPSRVGAQTGLQHRWESALQSSGLRFLDDHTSAAADALAQQSPLENNVCAMRASGPEVRSKYQKALFVAAQEEVAALVPYLVGTSCGGPLLDVQRASAYHRVDIGPVEARRLEFGPPEDRPTMEALRTLAALGPTL